METNRIGVGGGKYDKMKPGGGDDRSEVEFLLCMMKQTCMYKQTNKH